MANQSGWKAVRLSMLCLVVLGAGNAQAAKPVAAQATVVSESKLMPNGVYRSVLADGSIVFSDRPLAQAKSSTVVQYPSSAAASDLARAERDYWKQRSESFAARSRERERDLEETRRAALLADKRSTQAAVVIYTGDQSGYGGGLVRSNDPAANRTVYETSPGAVSGRLWSPISGGFTSNQGLVSGRPR